MRRRGRVLFAIAAAVLLVVAVTVAHRSRNRWPLLESETFDVRLSGSLRDVLPELSRITACQITSPTEVIIDGRQTQKADQKVALDFEHATLDTILRSLCRQAGLTYEAPEGPQSRKVWLYIGDSQGGRRRFVQVGDYIVEATPDVCYGASKPSTPGGTARVNTINGDVFALRLKVTSRTHEAYLHLVGIDNKMTAVTSWGRTVDLTPHHSEGDPGYYALRGLPFHVDEPAPTANLVLPKPYNGARRLAKLRGALRLYSTVTVTDFSIGPGDRGRTFEQDGVSATLTSWEHEGDDTLVAVRTTTRPIANGQFDVQFAGYRDGQTAVLVGRDGRKREGWSTLSPGDQYSSERDITFHFNPGARNHDPTTMRSDAPFEPDHIVLTFTRCGNADREVPFVIRDIPLPQTPPA